MQIQDIPETQNLNPDPLFSMKEAAWYLGISVSAMYKLAKEKKLQCVMVTSDRKIRQSVLDGYIKQSEQPWCWVNYTKN